MLPLPHLLLAKKLPKQNNQNTKRNFKDSEMEITTEMIKQLRAATNAPMLDCRKALQEADGNFDKAVDWLREKGMATAAKRADRDASNGTVELYSHGGGRVGVMVEINCETDFVARNEQFRKLAHEIALQIAASAPSTSLLKKFLPPNSSTKPKLPVPAPKKKANLKRHPQDRGWTHRKIQG
jgi:translation elongation factor Ts